MNAVKQYAGQLGLRWDDLGYLTSGEEGSWRGWWPRFRVEWYTFAFMIPDGIVVATVRGDGKTVHKFELYPLLGKGSLLPLWAAYPEFNSVTIGWRMGSGEFYKYRWHQWYRSLSDEERAQYRVRFPAPDDGAWTGFYEEIADRPAAADSVADFIMGRIP